MDSFLIDNNGIDHLKSLCGLEDLWLHATSMSIIWGRYALAPSISIQVRRGHWIILRGELGYAPLLKVEYDCEFAFISVSKAKAPESVQYIKHQHGFQMMDRNLSEIDFDRPYRLETVSVIRFEDKLDDEKTINYDGTLIFRFNDGREFSLSAYDCPGGLLEFSTDRERIDYFLENGTIKETIGN